jgi:hypothetical protein
MALMPMIVRLTYWKRRSRENKSGGRPPHSKTQARYDMVAITVKLWNAALPRRFGMRASDSSTR